MVTVRTGVPDDAYDIVRINAAGWRRAYVGIVPDDVLAAIDVDRRAERHRRLMTDNRTHESLVAVDGERIIGYVHFGPYRDGESLDHSVGEIAAIYVDPESWGTGAGRLLMEAALGRLAVHGYAEVRLWVLEANHGARGFYAHLGFQSDGTRATFPVRRPDGTVLGLEEVRYAWRTG
jgi:ribosomal protein S18 acetylase RimI-like enzyme